MIPVLAQLVMTFWTLRDRLDDFGCGQEGILTNFLGRRWPNRPAYILLLSALMAGSNTDRDMNRKPKNKDTMNKS